MPLVAYLHSRRDFHLELRITHINRRKRVNRVLLHVSAKAKIAMKKKTCQTSIDTHPVPKTEVNEKRVEIIATLYTADACADAAIFSDSSKV
jgi:hypothetical protein